MTTNTGAQDINPYGIAALAGMVGMFSKQATDKLGEVFSTFFKSDVGDKKRSNPLGVAKPAIGKIDPPKIPPGNQDREIMVVGSNFASGATLKVNDTSPATTFVSVTQLKAQLPAALVTNPGILKVKVINPNKEESPTVDLEVGP